VKTIAFAVMLTFAIAVPTNAFAGSHEIDIVVPWSSNQDTVQVVIVNKANLNEEKISIIKKVIESKVSYSNASQIYYEGWYGAIRSFDSKIKQFEIKVSQKTRQGDIIIELLTETHPLYNGYSIQHYAGPRIIHAQIQIHDSENITNIQLENLVRHEFGHALGMGHSNDQSTIMYTTMGEDPKFITSCDLVGLKALEDGKMRTSIDCIARFLDLPKI